MDPVIAAMLGLGALGVLVLMIPESAGLPLPSEAVMLLAGATVSHGEMALVTAVAAGTVGNLIGSLALYAWGRTLRAAALPARMRRGTRRCDELFLRYGDGAVFVGRLVPLVRSFVSLPAGHARMPLRRFVPLTTAGCAVWSTAFVIAGMVATS